MYIINKKSDKHTDVSEQGCRIDFNYIRTIFPDPYDFSGSVRFFRICTSFPDPHDFPADPYDFSGYVGFFPILYDPDPYELSGSVFSADPYDCFRIGQNS